MQEINELFLIGMTGFIIIIVLLVAGLVLLWGMSYHYEATWRFLDRLNRFIHSLSEHVGL